MRKRIFISLMLLLLLGMGLSIMFSFQINRYEYRLDDLHPKVKRAKDQLIRNCQNKQIEIRITQGLRTFDEQNELYAQGRTKPGNIVTYAKGGQSYHNYGLAIDFVVIDPVRKQPVWDHSFDGNQNGRSDWVEVAEEAKKLGFEWGGDWQGFKDYPHLQMTFDQSIWELYIVTRLRNFFIE